MAQGHRPDRVGEQIREELSAMLARGAVHDPGIGFITLTRVQVSPDLQLARIFYTTLGDPKARKETARALERATPFFRRQIGGRLRLRRVPEIEFRFDESSRPAWQLSAVDSRSLPFYVFLFRRPVRERV